MKCKNNFLKNIGNFWCFSLILHLSLLPLFPSPSSQLPDDLSLLPDEMKEVEGRRGEVKVGRSLFESVSVRETVKVRTLYTVKTLNMDPLSKGHLSIKDTLF